MTMTTLFRVRRYALAALVVLPVLVMSVFPQGTMASRGAGGLEVVLCTGSGPLTVTVDANGTPIEDTHDPADCGWWLLGQSLCDPGAAANPAPVATGFHGLSCVDTPFVDAVRPYASYQVRAPPLV